MISEVCDSIVGTIGNTPLVALDRFTAGTPGRILAKCEFLNPGGSIKDRIAPRILDDAERQGRLQPGGTVVEVTSGNTGIGLAMVCAVRGYRFVAVMSEGNSEERRRILAALGAEVVVVPQVGGSEPGKVSGADLEAVDARARSLVQERNAFFADQFQNPMNPASHQDATGEELWAQSSGKIDAFVAMIGTGGTFLGVARALKAHRPDIACYAAEPAFAQAIAGRPIECERHKIQGAGYASIPPQWDPELCDGTVPITDEEAIAGARELAKREGLMVGFSSGANAAAALRLLRKSATPRVVATVLPDTGLKYLSTDLYG